MGNKKPFYYHVADNGYIYDKRIFWLIILAVVGVVGYVGYINNFDFSYKFQVKCDSVIGSCENPLVDNSPYNPYTKKVYGEDCTDEWCYNKILMPGTYGEAPPPMVKYFKLIVFSLVILGIGLNHLVHNRGKVPGIKLNLPDKLNAKISEAWKRIKEKKDEEEGEE